MGKCSAGACPPLGSGWVWQKPPCEFAVQNRNSGFSYLGVPAATGMSDWYENALKRLASVPANPFIRHSAESRNPEGVGRGECSAGACPPLGRRRGGAESAVPIRRTKPQLLSPANCTAGLIVPTTIQTKPNLAVGSGFKPDLGWRGNRQCLGVDRPSGHVSSLPRKHAPYPFQRSLETPRKDRYSARIHTSFGTNLEEDPHLSAKVTGVARVGAAASRR